MTETGEDEGAGGTPKRLLLKDYAERYGSDVRTVKRWKARGLEKSDPLDFDDPEQLMGWWQRNMKQRVPPGITAAVVEWRKAGKSSPAAVIVAEPVVERAGDLPLQKFEKDEARAEILSAPINEDELGMDQTLRRVEELEVKLARTAADPGQTTAYVAIVGKLGLVRKALTDESIRLGKLIPRDRAETMIHSFHAPVEREIRLLYRTMCEITGIPQTPATEEMWNTECDRLFARFQEEVFR